MFPKNFRDNYTTLKRSRGFVVDCEEAEQEPISSDTMYSENVSSLARGSIDAIEILSRDIGRNNVYVIGIFSSNSGTIKVMGVLPMLEPYLLYDCELAGPLYDSQKQAYYNIKRVDGVRPRNVCGTIMHYVSNTECPLPSIPLTSPPETIDFARITRYLKTFLNDGEIETLVEKSFYFSLLKNYDFLENNKDILTINIPLLFTRGSSVNSICDEIKEALNKKPWLLLLPHKRKEFAFKDSDHSSTPGNDRSRRKPMRYETYELLLSKAYESHNIPVWTRLMFYMVETAGHILGSTRNERKDSERVPIDMMVRNLLERSDKILNQNRDCPISGHDRTYLTFRTLHNHNYELFINVARAFLCAHSSGLLVLYRPMHLNDHLVGVPRIRSIEMDTLQSDSIDGITEGDIKRILCMTNKSTLPLDSLMISRKDIFDVCEKLSNRIIAISKSKSPMKLVKRNSVDDNEEQNEVIDRVCDDNRRFVFVTGLPGTGKTKVIDFIMRSVKSLGRESYGVATITFNGNMSQAHAQRLREANVYSDEHEITHASSLWGTQPNRATSNNRKMSKVEGGYKLIVSTIHGFLRDASKNEHVRGYVKLIIIDECQNVDYYLMNKLVHLMDVNVKYVMIGDVNQTRPINAGRPYVDMTMLYPNLSTELVKNYRLTNTPQSVCNMISISQRKRNLLECVNCTALTDPREIVRSESDFIIMHIDAIECMEEEQTISMKYIKQGHHKRKNTNSSTHAPNDSHQTDTTPRVGSSTLLNKPVHTATNNEENEWSHTHQPPETQPILERGEMNGLLGFLGGRKKQKQNNAPNVDQFDLTDRNHKDQNLPTETNQQREQHHTNRTMHGKSFPFSFHDTLTTSDLVNSVRKRRSGVAVAEPSGAETRAIDDLASPGVSVGNNRPLIETPNNQPIRASLLGEQSSSSNNANLEDIMRTLYRESPLDQIFRIAGLSPLNEVNNALNHRIGPIIRSIVTERVSFGRCVTIEPVQLEMNMFGSKLTYSLAPGDKILFKQNIGAKKVVTERSGTIECQAVKNNNSDWIQSIEEKGGKIFITLKLSGGVICVPDQVPKKSIRLGYFSTVDSYMGSECSVCLFYIPPSIRKLSFFDNYRLLVAVSRAKVKNIIVGTPFYVNDSDISDNYRKMFSKGDSFVLNTQPTESVNVTRMIGPLFFMELFNRNRERDDCNTLFYEFMFPHTTPTITQ